MNNFNLVSVLHIITTEYKFKILSPNRILILRKVSTELKELIDQIKPPTIIRVKNNYFNIINIQPILLSQKNIVCISHLTLSRCNLQNEFILLLVKKLSSSESLKHLDISRNNLGDIGIENLIKIISEYKTLEYLNIGYNNITNKGIQLITETPICPTLRNLNISNNYFGDYKNYHNFSYILKKPIIINYSILEKLSIVNLSSNYIGNACIIKIAEVILNCSKLNYLNLSYNYISEEGISRILSVLHKYKLSPIIYINLCGNCISQETAIRLFKEFENRKLSTCINLFPVRFINSYDTVE